MEDAVEDALARAELWGALTQQRQALQHQGVVTLPAVAGLPAAVVARWLYREQLVASGQWWPMVHLDPAFLSARQVPASSIAQARGGWLFVDVGWPESWRATLEACGVTVLVAGRPGDDALHVTPTTRAALLAADRLHLVATDPALQAQRTALRAHCMAEGVVHLSGEPGTGKRALAEWVHSDISADPLVVVSRQAPLTQGQRHFWTLIEELADLPREHRRWVEGQLRAREAAPRVHNGVLQAEDTPVEPPHPAFAGIWTCSPSMASVLSFAARIAPHHHPVLIQGESGTGKELLARAIHVASGRTGPFVALDLSAVNEELLESELFGHVRGSFTGASRDRPGALRSAQGGTVLLDELGNLSLRVQARLLRVLQERCVRPVGSDRAIAVDVRIIAATNADLQGMVVGGDFREDLLMRLNTFAVRPPPLRERPEDIRFIAERIMARDGCTARLSDGALLALQRWRWPGNVRELEGVITRAAVMSDEEIPAEALGLPMSHRPAPILSTSSLAHSVDCGLSRSALHALTAITLRLPALRERRPEHRRALILSLLEGRAITTEALDALARQPWWGNLGELRACLGAAVANASRRPIDLPSITGLLPAAGAAAGVPIRLLFAPSLSQSGQLRGLSDMYDTSALVIGRARSVSELRAVLSAAPQRYDALAHLLTAQSVACLDLSLIPQLSRIHLVVSRGQGGLVVHCAPNTTLPVSVGRVAAGAGLPGPLAPGSQRAVGCAAELQIHSRSGDPLFRCFVFLGAAAWEDSTALVSQRVASSAGRSTITATRSRSVASSRPRARRSRRWVLTGPEIALLNQILVSFPGGQFKAWLTEALDTHRDDAATVRLRTFFSSAPNVGDYCARLYEYDGNEALRDAFAEALASCSDPDDLLSRLPSRLQRLFPKD